MSPQFLTSSTSHRGVPVRIVLPLSALGTYSDQSQPWMWMAYLLFHRILLSRYIHHRYYCEKWSVDSLEHGRLSICWLLNFNMISHVHGKAIRIHWRSPSLSSVLVAVRRLLERDGLLQTRNWSCRTNHAIKSCRQDSAGKSICLLWPWTSVANIHLYIGPCCVVSSLVVEVRSRIQECLLSAMGILSFISWILEISGKAHVRLGKRGSSTLRSLAVKALMGLCDSVLQCSAAIERNYWASRRALDIRPMATSSYYGVPLPVRLVFEKLKRPNWMCGTQTDIPCRSWHSNQMMSITNDNSKMSSGFATSNEDVYMKEEFSYTAKLTMMEYESLNETASSAASVRLKNIIDLATLMQVPRTEPTASYWDSDILPKGFQWIIFIQTFIYVYVWYIHANSSDAPSASTHGELDNPEFMDIVWSSNKLEREYCCASHLSESQCV